MQRRTKFEINAWLTILFLLGILLIAGALLKSHHQRIDVTKDKRFTLAPQTLKILKELPGEVKVWAFYLKPIDRQAQDLLDQYSFQNPKFKVQFVDPNREPHLAKSYGVNLNGTIVMQYQQKQEKITTCDEEKLTSALIKVTSKKVCKVYFLKGHGEKDLNDSSPGGLSRLKEVLEKEGYPVKDLLLATTPIPKDATIIVLAGPVKGYLPIELAALKKWLDEGGKLFCLFDPETPSDLAGFMAGYGFTLHQDVLANKVINLLTGKFSYDFNIPVSSYYRHAITEDFKLASYFPLCASLETQSGKVSIINLANTNSLSFNRDEIIGKKVSNLEAIKSKRGTFCVAAIGTFKVGEKEARLAVFGDSDFISNNFLGAYGNEDLFMNTLSWLAQEEKLISIRPKESMPTPLMLSASQKIMLFLVPVVGLPLAVLFIGIIIWIGKRIRN
jgi:ABC-type uncharacterized transport system involved in gliding motility auxiliary subunit